MQRTSRVWIVTVGAALGWLIGAACESGSSSSAPAEDTGPPVHVNLPPVPTLPPPPHPVQYPDGVYSVYGLRHKMSKVIDTEVKLKAFIVDIYHPEPCAPHQTCKRFLPHSWLADDAGEHDPAKRIRITNYAESQRDLDKALAAARAGVKQRVLPPGEGLPPIPTDFEIGKQFVFQGRFTRNSGSVLDSTGLIDYRGHAPLDANGNPIPAPGTPGAPTKH